MHGFFDWQVPKIVGLVFLAAVSVSAAGCGRVGPNVSNQQIDDPEVAQGSVDNTFVGQQIKLRTLITEADQHVVKGELDAAIEKYTTVLRHQWPESIDIADVGSHNAKVYSLRGKAFLAKRFPQIAIDDFDDAIKFGDDDLRSKVYVLRARAAGQLKRWSRVVADCTRAIRLQPKNGEAFLVRGEALAEMRQWNRARESMLEAERLGIRTTFKIPMPDSVATVLDQAKSSLGEGNPAVAREILERAILQGQDNLDTNGLLAHTLFQLNDFSGAIVASNRALRLDPRYAEAYRVRGLSWFQRDSLDQAISDLKAAITLDEALTEELNPWLTEARRRGGIEPATRATAINLIQQRVAEASEIPSSPGASERWLLDLVAMPNSSDQIEHLKSLLSQTPETEFDSLDWLADYLMLNRRVPAVNVLRTWLDRKSPNVSPVEKRLWESVSSRTAAASQDVNMFPDLAAYAVAYKYYDVLRTCIELEICRLKIDHMHQAVEDEDSRLLRIILPHSTLRDREVKSLLQQCLDKDRKEHARLIISKYEKNLMYEILEFLDMAE